MADDSDPRRRHFFLSGITAIEPYRSPSTGGRRAAIPQRERAVHGTALLRQLEQIRREAESLPEYDDEYGLDLQIEFESFPDIELAFESLARERSGIELLNVRHEELTTRATVFVPSGKLQHFEKLIGEYLEEKTNKSGGLIDHAQLVNAIRQIRSGSLRALWTDDPATFPEQAEGALWWEVWLPVRRDRQGVVARFRERAVERGMRVPIGKIEFPERTVILAYASVDQMTGSITTLNSIAELRRAKETAEFFDALSPVEQSEWLVELLGRVSFPENADAPHVCLLDTGVNRGHPLLESALSSENLHTVEPAWGTEDGHGHGTQMAGLALLGDLTPHMAASGPIEIEHRLESVKLLPYDGANPGEAQFHGYLMTEAVARPEVTFPLRKRVFAMSITARDNRDRGRPSAWSATIDRLASDAEGQGAAPRLLVISAGNIDQPDLWLEYPEGADTDGIHDPAQAWNALTVGASTNLVEITEPDASDYSVIAQAGGLSPFSTTSMTWDDHWPIKPDVLFEGGNAAKDSLSAVAMPSLSLLTTNHQPEDRLFTTSNATSAATAQCARMASQIMAVYSDLWPETVRALIVHSAEWTEQMKSMYLPSSMPPTKRDYRNLLRRCGFGVPHLETALWSVSNSLTMVVQEAFQPFKREKGKSPALREMHLHNLPWPQEALEALGEVEVEMRVTLSYFIEPNPSARGTRSRYRYPSHGLRFDVKRPSESTEAFRARVNAAARDEEEGTSSTDADPKWVVGKQGRHRGSLHSDTWRGTAAELASRGRIAICPTLGWWKTRPALERYNQLARYALIVSIKAPEVETDLYTEIENLIGIPVVVEV